jgi:hypothetical protein
VFEDDSEGRSVMLVGGFYDGQTRKIENYSGDYVTLWGFVHQSDQAHLSRPVVANVTGDKVRSYVYHRVRLRLNGGEVVFYVDSSLSPSDAVGRLLACYAPTVETTAGERTAYSDYGDLELARAVRTITDRMARMAKTDRMRLLDEIHTLADRPSSDEVS